MENKGEIILYNSNEIQETLQVKLYDDTVWLTQKQLADLLDKDTDTIGKHIKTIYSDQESAEEATTAKFVVVQKEGDREIKRILNYYTWM